MAPVAVVQNGEAHTNGVHKGQNGHASSVKLPMQSNGSLDDYNFKDLTPCIGREFPTANLVDMMNAPNSDELLAELAMTSAFQTVPSIKSLQLTDVLQSLSVVSSGLGNKTISRTICKRNSSSESVSFLDDHLPLAYISTLFSTARAKLENSVIQTKRSAPLVLNCSVKSTAAVQTVHSARRNRVQINGTVILLSSQCRLTFHL
jgi:hypothetical protein